MSISIAHPERYSETAWTIDSNIAAEVGEWGCLGATEFLTKGCPGGDRRVMKHFWGHLKPEYREPSELTELVEDLRLRLKQSSDLVTLNKGAHAIVMRRADRACAEAERLWGIIERAAEDLSVGHGRAARAESAEKVMKVLQVHIEGRRKCPPGSFPVYRSESGERSAKFSDVMDAMEGKEIGQ